jgi:hypothetical protein
MIDDVFAEVRADRDGGANGSIIGRTTFQLPKSERSTCSTRSISTKVELLAAAQDAGKVGLGAGIIAHVVGEDLVDMAIHLHRSAPPGDGVSPF